MIVKSVKTQYKIANLKGRAVRLDIYAVDEQGGVHNIEFQRERYGAFPKRLRYNQSLVDANALKKGEKVDKLPDVHVIMVMEKKTLNRVNRGENIRCITSITSFAKPGNSLTTVFTSSM